jgi:hypothetical protein
MSLEHIAVCELQEDCRYVKTPGALYSTDPTAVGPAAKWPLAMQFNKSAQLNGIVNSLLG